MTQLFVSGYATEEQVRLKVGIVEEKEGEQVDFVFGYGSEVFGQVARFGEEGEALVSQGGIGGQSVETARARSAAFVAATDYAEVLDKGLRGGLTGFQALLALGLEVSKDSEQVWKVELQEVAV